MILLYWQKKAKNALIASASTVADRCLCDLDYENWPCSDEERENRSTEDLTAADESHTHSSQFADNVREVEHVGKSDRLERLSFDEAIVIKPIVPERRRCDSNDNLFPMKHAVNSGVQVKRQPSRIDSNRLFQPVLPPTPGVSPALVTLWRPNEAPQATVISEPVSAPAIIPRRSLVPMSPLVGPALTLPRKMSAPQSIKDKCLPPLPPPRQDAIQSPAADSGDFSDEVKPPPRLPPCNNGTLKHPTPAARRCNANKQSPNVMQPDSKFTISNRYIWLTI